MLSNEVKSAISRAYETYKAIDVADGIAWCSPEFYRQYLLRVGQYTPEIHEAFEVLTDYDGNIHEILGAEEYSRRVDLALKHVALSPIKATYNGPRSDSLYIADTLRIFDKPAIFPVFSFMAARDARFKSMYDFMTNQDNRTKGVMFKMASATKVGALTSDRQAKFDDSNTYTRASYSQNYEYLRRQQLVEPHHPGEISLGVQIKRIVLGNLHSPITTSKVNGYDSIKAGHINNLAG
jgi:hypothetical protein